MAGTKMSRDDMIALYRELSTEYRLASVEDALYEDDFEGWAQLTTELPEVQWVGDDFFVTNPERLRKGIEMGAANVRGERTSKYNQLLRIEEELGDQAVYAGRNFRWRG